MVDNYMPGAWPVWGTVGRIYKEEYYTLLHTKYESSGPCGFGEEDVFPIVSLWELLASRGMIRRIHVKVQITMLHTKYRSFCSCSFRDEGFTCIFHYKVRIEGSGIDAIKFKVPT